MRVKKFGGNYATRQMHQVEGARLIQLPHYSDVTEQFQTHVLVRLENGDIARGDRTIVEFDNECPTRKRNYNLTWSTRVSLPTKRTW